MRVILLFGVLLGLTGFSAVPPVAGQDKPDLLVQASNEQWLALVDAAKYDESWDAASAQVKAAVTKEQWTRTMTASRSPLGKVVTRVVASSTYTRTLPGVPDGEYVVTLYTTRFEHKQSAEESIISVLEKDGEWRVAGYYFK
jgi:hypothetical protein